MPAKPAKILIVDDEPAIRRALSVGLTAGGHLVESAQSAEEAIEAIHQQSFDLVLLDIKMTGMGGLEACRRIRPLAPNTGIVMITVCDSLEEKVTALDSGADDYIRNLFCSGSYLRDCGRSCGEPDLSNRQKLMLFALAPWNWILDVAYF
jgi:DNA-binding response OmpR family regulator